MVPKGAGTEQHCRVQTANHSGTFLPIHAEFEVIEVDARGRKKNSELVTFDFSWEVINELISGGLPAGKRLSLMHDIPLVVE